MHIASKRPDDFACSVCVGRNRAKAGQTWLPTHPTGPHAHTKSMLAHHSGATSCAEPAPTKPVQAQALHCLSTQQHDHTTLALAQHIGATVRAEPAPARAAQKQALRHFLERARTKPTIAKHIGATVQSEPAPAEAEQKQAA